MLVKEHCIVADLRVAGQRTGCHLNDRRLIAQRLDVQAYLHGLGGRADPMPGSGHRDAGGAALDLGFRQYQLGLGGLPSYLGRRRHLDWDGRRRRRLLRVRHRVRRSHFLGFRLCPNNAICAKHGVEYPFQFCAVALDDLLFRVHFTYVAHKRTAPCYALRYNNGFPGDTRNRCADTAQQRQRSIYIADCPNIVHQMGDVFGILLQLMLDRGDAAFVYFSDLKFVPEVQLPDALGSLCRTYDDYHDRPSFPFPFVINSFCTS